MIRGEEILRVSEHSYDKKKDHKGTKQQYRRPPVNTQNNNRQDKRRQDTYHHDHQSKCGNCGTTHGNNRCPVKGTTCKYCKKPDHWLKVCRKRLRKINMIQEVDQNSCDSQDSGDELLYISTVKTETWRNSEDRWIVDVHIGDKALPVRIDTGAKCSIISKKSLNK